MNRRKFLTTTSMAAGAFAAACSTSAAPTARFSPKSRIIGANDDIRVAVIGFNSRGRDHIEGFKKLKGVRLVALCDVDSRVLEKGRAELAKEGIQVETFTDVRKLLERGDIDVISTATPNHWHALIAIWGCQAGKDVYVEKPVSHNVWEGRQIVKAARKYGRIVQTGTQSRSNPGLREAIDWLHAGNLGTVKVARGLCYKPRQSIGKVSTPTALPSEIDYNLWCGPSPLQPLMREKLHYDWHWQFVTGNGDVGNQGIHQMDIARWALGKSVLPNKVHSVGGRFGYSDQGETPNTVVTTFEYGDQTLVFEVRGLDTPEYTGVSIGNIVYGTEGYVVFSSNYAVALAFDKAGNEVQKFSGGGDHFGNFVKAVRNRDTAALNAPIVEGHLSSALCHLGNISYRLGEPAVPAKELTGLLASNKHGVEAVVRYREHLKANNVDTANAMGRLGRVISIDPKKESITGDAEAATMLTRPYRTGFAVPSKI